MPATVFTGEVGYFRNTASETAPFAPCTPGTSGMTAVLGMYFGRILLSSLWLVVPGPLALVSEQPASAPLAASAPRPASAKNCRRFAAAPVRGSCTALSLRSIFRGGHRGKRGDMRYYLVGLPAKQIIGPAAEPTSARFQAVTSAGRGGTAAPASDPRRA